MRTTPRSLIIPQRPELASLTFTLKPNLFLAFIIGIIDPEMVKILEIDGLLHAIIYLVTA